MPNRMLRDWTDSKKVSKLSANAERLLIRIIMKADDYGMYHADVERLRPMLFPFQLKQITENQLSDWMLELIDQDLIITYTVKGEKYLRIIDFKQRLDRARSKFPFPPENSENQDRTISLTTSGQSLDQTTDPPPERKGSRKEVEVEVEVEQMRNACALKYGNDILGKYEDFKKWVSKNTPRVDQMKNPITLDQYGKIREKIPKEVVQKILMAMQNRADLLKKYVSAYLTLTNWAERESKNITNEPSESQTNRKLKEATAG